jgi:hypothetical protein
VGVILEPVGACSETVIKYYDTRINQEKRCNKIILPSGLTNQMLEN